MRSISDRLAETAKARSSLLVLLSGDKLGMAIFRRNNVLWHDEDEAVLDLTMYQDPQSGLAIGDQVTIEDSATAPWTDSTNWQDRGQDYHGGLTFKIVAFVQVLGNVQRNKKVKTMLLTCVLERLVPSEAVNVPKAGVPRIYTNQRRDRDKGFIPATKVCLFWTGCLSQLPVGNRQYE